MRLGALRVSQAFVPRLLKSPAGRIVNVSSGAGQLSDMGTWSPAYAASKTTLNAITCLLAAALKDKGIAVNSVCPGWCRTEMGGANAPRSVEEGAAGIVWLAADAPQDKTGLFWRDKESHSLVNASQVLALIQPMPLLRLETSVALSDDQQQQLLASLSKIVAETIGKPEQYVMVTVGPAAVLMAGKPGDAAFVDIRSIGGLSANVNRQLSQKVCALLAQTLQVPQNRLYLNFTEVEAGSWGWNGNTFG